MSLKGHELGAQLKARGPALKKDWLLKKQGAGEVLASLAEDAASLGAKPVAKLAENLSHPVAAYALALLLEDAPGEAPETKAVEKLRVKKGQLITGDLHVKGTLAVESNLVVVGNLEAGRITVGEGGSLAVGGKRSRRTRPSTSSTCGPRAPRARSTRSCSSLFRPRRCSPRTRTPTWASCRWTSVHC